jgi:para-nitrobenzyl esterase
METYWTNFAKTGDPNSSGEAKWEPLSGTSGYLEFGLDGHAEFRNAILRGPQCDLFGKVISQRMKDGE